MTIMSKTSAFVPTFSGSASASPHNWVDRLPAKAGFVADPRYSKQDDPSVACDTDTAGDGTHESDDTEAAAYQRGFEQGLGEARSEAAAQSGREASERRKLGSALRRMDETMTERLGEELSHTIVALCEATLAPLTLDVSVLQSRCHEAAAMLGRRHTDRVLYLAPKDIGALDPEFAAEWTIRPDPQMELGSLRIEQDGGGVADGPAEWRAAIRQAVGLC